jgi:2-amino-1-hydroxyethylphosphonate dioxygenase (glycine-forming)
MMAKVAQSTPSAFSKETDISDAATSSTDTIPTDAESLARLKIRSLFAYLDAQGSADYIGEPISQLEHSLQAAHLALESLPASQRENPSPAERDLILSALLHDVGRFIPAADEMPKMIAADGTYVGREAHEVVGEKYLQGLGFGKGVSEVVGAHVWAKRYLCATEKGYWEDLSQSSKTTLKFQVSDFRNGLEVFCYKF